MGRVIFLVCGGLRVNVRRFVWAKPAVFVFRRQGAEDVQLRADGGGLGFEFVQMFLGGFEGAGGQAGEFGDGDAVAFAGGAGVDVVEEDDVLSLFERGEVHIDRRRVGFGQFGQFEIVSGEEAEGFVFLQQVFGDGVREGEAVEGGGAASDFVHEDEGLVGGVVEDVGGFAHFDHEGGAVGGEVVGGADAGEDLVDGSDLGGIGGDEAAGVRHEDDVGDLAHVGGFAAHVGAGQEHEAVFVVEAGVVGGEVAHLLLDDGMAAVFDMDDGVVGELGADEAAFGGSGGEGGEYVQRSGGFGGFLKLGQGRLNVFEEGFKQAFFQCQCLLLRGQDFVFEGFEFGGDEAFGVFQGLAALVVGGGLFGLDFG